MFDHECPAIGNNKLNMSKSDCVSRIASGDRKCATCPSGVGYVKPGKKKQAGRSCQRNHQQYECVNVEYTKLRLAWLSVRTALLKIEY